MTHRVVWAEVFAWCCVYGGRLYSEAAFLVMYAASSRVGWSGGMEGLPKGQCAHCICWVCGESMWAGTQDGHRG